MISDLQGRIAKLEKSAGRMLPKKVLAELEDLLSDHPFYENDMDTYWFTIEAHRVKELDDLDEISNRSESFFVYKYEVEATITLNDLIVDNATIEDSRAKLYHFVDEALEQADFRDLRVLSSQEIEVKRIGTPTLKTSSNDISKLEVPVKLVLLADGKSDLLVNRRANSRLERQAGKTRRRVPRDHFRRPSRNIMPRDLDKVRSKAIPPNAYDDIPFSGGQHDFYGALHELVEDGLDSDQIVTKLTRRFKVKAPFILEELRRFYGKQMRVASTRKVAGHIVLEGTVNVRQLRSDLEDKFCI